MPHYVTNIIEIKDANGIDINDIRKAFVNDEGLVDFNLILGMTEYLVENCGKKWNAYNQPNDGHPKDATIYRFDTAWSHPKNMMLAVSKKVPGVLFSIKYADEDYGSNCGAYDLINGEIKNADIAPSWSSMSDQEKRKYKKFAFDLINPGADHRSEGYDENFEYSDEIYEAYEAENS